MIAGLLLLLLGAPDAEALAQEYFAADAARRIAILGELRPVDTLDAASLAKWRTRLLALAGKGPRLKRKGQDYFYDDKTKRGRYIVGGGSGRGGLLIGLHGGGAGAGDAGEAAGVFQPIASKFDCVGIFPEVLEKTERGWTTSGTEEFVLALIEAAKRTWKIDPNRVYMVGHSMGGYGSWTVGARHADLFAGLGPYAGAPTPYMSGEEILGIEDGVLPNLLNVALHVYQSLDDKNVPPGPNIFAARELEQLRAQYGPFNFRYVQVDGRGHGPPPGGHVEGFAWLYQFPRAPRPKRVLWQPVLSWNRMFYWLWWDHPVPKTLVDAQVSADNTIDVDLGGTPPAGLRILLDDRLVDLGREVVIRVEGKEVFRGKVPLTLSTLLMTAAERNDPELLFPARVDL